MSEIPINQVIPNPKQPRKSFDDSALAELAESVKQVGLLNPILVRPAGDKFEIVHGERRWRASQLAGLETIRVEIRELDDKAAFLMALTENLQRDELNAIEEARAIQTLIGQFGYSQKQAAEMLGKSQPWISGRLGLLTLPDDLQEKVITRVITPSAARELSRVNNPEEQARLASKAAAGNLTVRELEAAKAAPEGEWPPPDRPNKTESFHDVLEWARRRLTYLDSNPVDYASPMKNTFERKIVDLYLMRAAGCLFNQIRAYHDNDPIACNLIREKAGKLVLTGIELFHAAVDCRKEDMELVDQDLKPLLNYSWDKDLLMAIGWIDNDCRPLPRLRNFSPVVDMICELFWVILWTHGNWRDEENRSDLPPWSQEDIQKSWENAQMADMPEETKELAWAWLVKDKYKDRVEITPTGLRYHGGLNDLSYEEWLEFGRAIAIMASILKIPSAMRGAGNSIN